MWIRSAVWALVLGLASAGSAVAEAPLYYAADGVALDGYDVVAFFDQGRPVEGSPGIALMWRGTVWHFASQDALTAFEMNPTAYAPQFGGYCAYAIANGKVASPAPEAFFLHDGKLYFMHSARLLNTMKGQLPRIVTQAEARWPAPIGR